MNAQKDELDRHVNQRRGKTQGQRTKTGAEVCKRPSEEVECGKVRKRENRPQERA